MRFFIVLMALAGCAQNGFVDPAHYGTKHMRHDWAMAVSDGSLECRELLAIGPKPGCKFNNKTNECVCQWTDSVATETGWADVTRVARFNACGALHALGEKRADAIFSTIPGYELAATIEPTKRPQ